MTIRASPTAVINVVTFLVFIALGKLVVREIDGPQISGASRNSQQPQLIAAGQELPRLSGYRWSSHKRTLVLALRKGCHYCQDSVPFYRQLVALENSGALRDVHILAIFPDPKDVVGALLESEQLIISFGAHLRSQ